MSIQRPRLAIVTGAGSGLGRAFCRQLALSGEGWHIVAIDVDAAGLEETLVNVGRLPSSEGQAEVFDVTDAGAWLDLSQRLRPQWPRLDMLVGNAGICMSAEVGDGELDQWRRVWEVNFDGVLNGCHIMTPWLKESAAREQEGAAGDVFRSGGRLKPAIINIASIAAYLPAPAMGAYAASKAAVVALSEAMYAELRPHGVHVTVVAPGFFRTQLLTSGAFAERRHRAQAEQLARAARFDADVVARESLAASARGQLYVVLGRRARWFWRWKRSAPVSLLKAVSRRYRRMMLRDENAGD